MAAGEDQPQPVVLDAFLPGPGLGGKRIERLLVDVGEALLPPDRVDRLEAPGGHEPGAGVLRDAVPRPLLERRAESLRQGLLREVEVAEQPHQRGEHAARVLAIDLLEDRARVHAPAY